jgi:hypothetical protein
VNNDDIPHVGYFVVGIILLKEIYRQDVWYIMFQHLVCARYAMTLQEKHNILGAKNPQ